MVLVFKFLDEVKDANSFMEVDGLSIVKGNKATIYFKLVQNKQDVGQGLENIRYLPSSAATVLVKFDHIDSDKVLLRPATMPFPLDDRSIWKVDILSTDTSVAFNSMSVTLTDGSDILTVLPASDLVVVDPSEGRFYC